MSGGPLALGVGGGARDGYVCECVTGKVNADYGGASGSKIMGGVGSYVSDGNGSV